MRGYRITYDQQEQLGIVRTGLEALHLSHSAADAIVEFERNNVGTRVTRIVAAEPEVIEGKGWRDGRIVEYAFIPLNKREEESLRSMLRAAIEQRDQARADESRARMDLARFREAARKLVEQT